MRMDDWRIGTQALGQATALTLTQLLALSLSHPRAAAAAERPAIMGHKKTLVVVVLFFLALFVVVLIIFVVFLFVAVYMIFFKPPGLLTGRLLRRTYGNFHIIVF